MAFNSRSGGITTEAPVDETVRSGDVVVLGDIAGIAELDATERADGQHWTTVALEGIAYLNVGTEPTIGQAVYANAIGELDVMGDAPEAGEYTLVGYVTNETPTANGGYEIKLANGPKVVI